MPILNRTYSRSQNEEPCSGAGGGKRSYRTSNLQNEQDIPLKQDFPLIQSRRARPAIFSKLFATSVQMAHSSLKTQYGPVLGVKAFVPSCGHANPVDSLSTVSIKGMSSLGSHSSVSTSNNCRQYSKSREQVVRTIFLQLVNQLDLVLNSVMQSISKGQFNNSNRDKGRLLRYFIKTLAMQTTFSLIHRQVQLKIQRPVRPLDQRILKRHLW